MADSSLFHAFRFDVQIEVKGLKKEFPKPLCEAAFAECDGLEMTIEPKVYREGGNNTEQIKRIGSVSYGNLTLKRGMTTNFDLWEWFNSMASEAGKGAEATVLVRILDPSSNLSTTKVKAKFQLNDCLPIKIRASALNAKDGQIAIEEMQIAYSSILLNPPE